MEDNYDVLNMDYTEYRATDVLHLLALCKYSSSPR